MSPVTTTSPKPLPDAATAGRLEDLIPIAVAIAAGCERCAERTVRRSLEQGSSARAVARTLGIVAHMRSLDCFAKAVPAQVIARMAGPLRAGERALAEGRAAAGEGRCCG